MYNYAKYPDHSRITLYFPEVLLYDINQFVTTQCERLQRNFLNSGSLERQIDFQTRSGWKSIWYPARKAVAEL